MQRHHRAKHSTARTAVQGWMVNKLFVCEKKHSCCDYMYWDRLDDVDKEAKECGHLLEVAEVLHGRWMKTEDDYCGLNIVKCSVCREEWCFEVEDDVFDLNYHYCPNCGAKMDLEVQE